MAVFRESLPLPDAPNRVPVPAVVLASRRAIPSVPPPATTTAMRPPNRSSSGASPGEPPPETIAADSEKRARSQSAPEHSQPSRPTEVGTKSESGIGCESCSCRDGNAIAVPEPATVSKRRKNTENHADRRKVVAFSQQQESPHVASRQRSSTQYSVLSTPTPNAPSRCRPAKGCRRDCCDKPIRGRPHSRIQRTKFAGLRESGHSAPIQTPTSTECR